MRNTKHDSRTRSHKKKKSRAATKKKKEHYFFKKASEQEAPQRCTRQLKELERNGVQKMGAEAYKDSQESAQNY
jgi:hypothetical protein